MAKGSSGVAKHVLGFHYRSPGVVMLKVGLHHGCPDSDQELSQGGKVSNRLQYSSLKEVEFMMKLYYESIEGGEASIEASLHRLQHQYEF